jgi:hypothetical protein
VLRATAGSTPHQAQPPEQGALAALGGRLGELAIQSPAGGAALRSPFTETPDLFVVVTVSPWQRRCAVDATDCFLGGVPPDTYFQSRANGTLQWLRYGGGAGLAPERVAHLAVVTPEDLDAADLLADCERQPNFPATHLDLLEAAGHRYYDRPGVAALDYCAIVSDPTSLAAWARSQGLP